MLIRGVSKAVAATALVGGIFLLAVSPPATAQSTPELQSQIEDAFRQLLRDPGNVALTYRYAQLQMQAENYEAAAGARRGDALTGRRMANSSPHAREESAKSPPSSACTRAGSWPRQWVRWSTS